MSLTDRALTAKGERQALAIVEAALTCLARDGYAGTSLQRVADEAGLGKRTVLYYFGSREDLFTRVLSFAGDRLLDQVEAATRERDDLEDVIGLGFDRLWTGMTTDRPLLIAWYGLLTESVTNPALRGATTAVSQRARALLSRIVDEGLARGYQLHGRREALETLVLATLQGLILDYLENGSTPRLEAAVADFQGLLRHLYTPA